MGLLEFTLIGLGLAMDAFAVAIGKGLTLQKITPRHACITGLWFGGFQAVMPVIGYLLAHSFSSVMVSVDHWIAFALLMLIGGNMIRETIWGEEESHTGDFGLRTMFIMAVATSIDALAVGVSMAFMDINIWHAIAVIGIITFVLAAAGIYLGRLFGAKIGARAGIFGGLLLMGIGVKILVEHLSE